MAEEWTNEALKALIDTEGDKIRSIKSSQFQVALNVPLAGYPTLTKEDLTLTTLGGTEVIKCRKWSTKLGKYYYEYLTTAMIEKVTVVEDEKDQLDPYDLQF